MYIAVLVLYIVGSPGGLSAGIRKIQVSFKRSRIVSTHMHVHTHVTKIIVINDYRKQHSICYNDCCIYTFDQVKNAMAHVTVG